MDSATPTSVRGKRRARSGAPGRARYEVHGLDRDRTLIRALARRLAEDGPGAARLRALVSGAVISKAVLPAPEGSRVGGIVAALLASPLVGSGIDLTRTRHPGRDIDL